MSRTFFKRALMPVSLLCLSLPVAADGEHAALTLPPTVVTGAFQQSPLTMVTDPGNPRQPIPASDAADYLRSIPGFSAIGGGGTNADPVLRGLFGSRLKLLTNGGEMLGACPSRMDTPASYIAPETYDLLTVIKGPQTVVWGPGASAGTVLFERRPEHFEGPGQRLNASLTAASGTRRDLLLDGALGSPEGYLRLGANRSRAGDYRDGKGNRVPSRWNKWNADMALGWTPDEETLLEVSAGSADGEARYAGRGMDGARFKRESLAMRFERGFSGTALEKLQAQLYYNHADHIMNNYSLRSPPATGMMAGSRASHVDRRTLGARMSGTWRWGDLEWILGADAQRNSHRARSGMRSTFRTQSLREDGRFSQLGVFSELTWNLDEQHRLVGGARLDRHRVHDERASAGGGMGMPLTPNPTANGKRSDSLPSGFVRLEQDLAGMPAKVYAGIGHAQRFPDYWELFSPGQAENAVNAFAGVEPERTTQVDMGINYRDGRLEAWVSAYAGQVRDYILFDYVPGMMGTISRVDNVDVRIMGAELGAAYTLNQAWSTDAALAWAWGKNRGSGAALAQIPPLEARLGLTYRHDDWSVGALWRVVAAQRRTAFNQGNVVGRDLGDSSGYGVLSLNGAWRVGSQTTLSAGIDNLLDKTYAEHLNLAGNTGFGYPAEPTRINEPGRTLWVKLDLSF